MHRNWIIFLLVGVLLLAACEPRTTPAEPTMARGQRMETEGGAYTLLTVEELRDLLAEEDPLLVNVHIPYEGEIEGTDLHIPYNAVEDHLSDLPDRDARIVVYCRSGPMSEIAARALVGLGYTDILDVAGGMMAWEEAGMPLVE